MSDEEVQQAYRQRHERVRAAWAYADVKPADGRGAGGRRGPRALRQGAPGAVQPARAAEAAVRGPELQEARGHCVGRGGWRPTTRSTPPSSSEPKRLRVAHVLVRVPPVGGSDAENTAKAKVEDVIKRAKGGEDFAKLAREISEDKASAVQGGDLGFVGAGELVRALRAGRLRAQEGRDLAPRSAPPSAITRSGCSTSRRAARPRSRTVAPKIKETLGAQKSEQAAQTRADEVRATLLSAQGLPRRGEAARARIPGRRPSAAATRSARRAAIPSSTRPSSGSRWAASPRRSRPRAASRSSRSCSRSRPGCRRWRRSGTAWWRRSSASGPSSR